MPRSRWPPSLRPAVWLPLAVMLVVLGLAWQLGARLWPYLLPPLQSVLASLAANATYYLRSASITLGEALAGLAIGLAVGCALAVLISELPLARRAIMPVAVVANVTPLVAVAPALVVAFGFGPAPKVILTALICFFPILINAATGLRSVPAQILQVYQSVAASRLEVLLYLRMPSALPFLFAALRIVFPLSVIGAVVAELTAAGSAGGLGTVVAVASSTNHLDVEYAAIFVLAAMGTLLLLAVTLIERRALRWYNPKEES
jgi:NitT/TauT family transport system permease protein